MESEKKIKQIIVKVNNAEMLEQMFKIMICDIVESSRYNAYKDYDAFEFEIETTLREEHKVHSHLNNGFEDDYLYYTNSGRSIKAVLEQNQIEIDFGEGGSSIFANYILESIHDASFFKVKVYDGQKYTYAYECPFCNTSGFQEGDSGNSFIRKTEKNHHDCYSVEILYV